MKTLKILTVTVAVAIVGFALTLTHAEEGKAPGKGRGEGKRGSGPPLEHLLPPRAVEGLNLTADQKTKLNELTTAFQQDAKKWREAHPVTDADREAVRQARESGDKAAVGKFAEQRKELLDIRKSYVAKFRASLTDEQKAKLDKPRGDARERTAGKGPRGEKGERDGKKGAKPPPAE